MSSDLVAYKQLYKRSLPSTVTTDTFSKQWFEGLNIKRVLGGHKMQRQTN